MSISKEGDKNLVKLVTSFKKIYETKLKKLDDEERKKGTNCNKVSNVVMRTILCSF